MSPEDNGLKPLDSTLVRVVVLMRVLGWVWLIVLGAVTLATKNDVNTALIGGSMAVATIGMAGTVVAGRRGILANPVYVTVDGVITILLALVGPLAGAGDFIAGGYPASWLFIVAYASNVRVTALLGALASLLFAVLHVVMGLGATRAYGSIQFLVIAVVVGWGFDSLRRQEALRFAAEEEREAAEAELRQEQARTARLEERSRIAVQLHDSVLQTLKLIRSSAEDSAEVRYLARAQERDLRRTISDYESPYLESFRAGLLEVQADVEDMYRVEIDQVIKDDEALDETLRAIVLATRDVMVRAVSDDGATRFDLFTEIRSGAAEVSIRSFPTAGSAEPLSTHVAERLEELGADWTVRPAPGDTRELTIRVPR